MRTIYLYVQRSTPPVIRPCRGPKCGKPVEWVRTERGKAMPITHPLEVVRVHEKFDGTLVTVVKGEQSHWATCPDAEQFKTKTQKTPRQETPVESPEPSS